MYLPELGIDLREHFKKPPEKRKQFLSRAAQVAIIYVLVKEMSEKLTPSVLAKQLGYSIMTVNRAFEELRAANIGKVRKQGRELVWTITKRDLWEQAKERMHTPVKKRIWLREGVLSKKNNILAGLSALSHYSMLNPPQLSIYALSSIEFKNLKLSKKESLSFPEDGAVELEIWTYAPGLFQQEGYVDSFSLYLSLRESTEERVETALEEMMEKIKW